ncbi:DUF2156 domain containing protein [Sulfitobacter noctilucicola]|uniref:Phosphatidylglycerol lysyltransferase n=1 Tax=Sulfitobacter noctilucicola TaxID=1342301 RepID=A0A7W6Q3S1_9RHOB|nr:phosphatidylglycerol lysyltransferase domain-containing protein [Sulfitobacter noctilucicola]KIN64940.1 DUF2156 domain containing protein [Sulfitobacter noctilucicola]MBB4173918.1 phosphatidylglycerol lysyltransferase [Sulfitobacter noctilucicola]
MRPEIKIARKRVNALRAALPFFVMGFCIWLLMQRVDLSALTNLPALLRGLTPSIILGVSLLCAASLWAVARYDSVAHRHFATGVTCKCARQSGFAAIAVAQTAGFGVFTGAVVRWRMLQKLSFAQALRLAGFVTLTFLLALVYLTSLAAVVLPAPDWLFWPAIGVTFLLPPLWLWLSFDPYLRPFSSLRFLPSLTASAAILGWATLDILAAALALYLLCPTSDVAFAAFLPAFMLALGTGLVSGAPGGIGAFELTLLALLPQLPPAEMITGIMAFRLFYYAGPAIIAVAMVLRSPSSPPDQRYAFVSPARRPYTGECAVLLQNGGRLAEHPEGSFALWHTRQTATLMFDPVEGSAKAALGRLCADAKSHGLIPFLYKGSARTALAARQKGWSVMRTAQEAVVDVASFDLNSPARRSLRRKLRKAQTAGVIVGRASQLPIAEMARIDALWQSGHGTARGGTMGRFCPAYLSRQEVFVAYRAEELIAFASFHYDARSMTLDLMRHQSSLPDGTMHALIAKALAYADKRNKMHVSLAAVPDLPHWMSRLPFVRARAEDHGLRQFKNSFATDLRPLYAAAPGPLSLALGLADIAFEVHAPAALKPYGPPHEQDEQYEFAFNTHP